MKVKKEIQIELVSKLLTKDQGLISLAHVLSWTNSFGFGIHGYDWKEGFYKREGMGGLAKYYNIKWDLTNDDLRLQDNETQTLVLSWVKGFLFFKGEGWKKDRMTSEIEKNNYE